VGGEFILQQKQSFAKGLLNAPDIDLYGKVEPETELFHVEQKNRKIKAYAFLKI